MIADDLSQLKKGLPLRTGIVELLRGSSEFFPVIICDKYVDQLFVYNIDSCMFTKYNYFNYFHSRGYTFKPPNVSMKNLVTLESFMKSVGGLVFSPKGDKDHVWQYDGEVPINKLLFSSSSS